jgi:hypothetical protein
MIEQSEEQTIQQNLQQIAFLMDVISCLNIALIARENEKNDSVKKKASIISYSMLIEAQKRCLTTFKELDNNLIIKTYIDADEKEGFNIKSTSKEEH